MVVSDNPHITQSKAEKYMVLNREIMVYQLIYNSVNLLY